MQELDSYYSFTAPARLNKAVNTLRGLVAGIKADGVAEPEEAVELANWCSLYVDLKGHQPFDTLLPLIEDAISDGILDDEERADILWACDHACGFCEYYDDIAGSIQYLNGIAHGLIADGTLSDNEINALHEWLTDNDFLSGTYPFDELYSITAGILADGKITEDERNTLMVALGELVDFKTSYNLSEADFRKMKEKYTIQGVCALCPEISFEGKTFVLSGESARASRQELAEKIVSLGGLVKSSVSKKTDYLVIGNEGNPCWAFSCYGRKIEDALKLRKAGAKLIIVNETDFWDSVLDAEAGIK